MADKNPILEAAKRVPAQIVFGGADLLNLALGLISGKGLSGVTPKSPSETINQDVFGLAEPEFLSTQNAAEMAAGLINPGKAIGLGAKALGSAVPALVTLMEKATPAVVAKIAKSQAGVIRPGGALDLNMFHATDPVNLLKRKEFTAPSIAITSNRGNDFSSIRDVNLVLNPNYKGFDPETSSSILHNRDMYVSRDKSTQRPGRRGEDVRLTEESGVGDLSLQQALSIMLSPKFQSFSNYEKSPIGADLLRKFTDEYANKKYQAAKTSLISALDSVGLNSSYKGVQANSKDYVEKTLANLRQASSSGNKKASEALAKLSLTPASYAELKMVDELPLNESTISGVIINPLLASDTAMRSKLEKALPGIPIGTPAELLPKEYRDLYKNLTESTTALVNKKTGTVVTTPYGSWLSDAQSATPLETIAFDIINSDKFLSDVASMLTSTAAK